jgi:multidrug efflux pump subunit AcrA (membrane-fusion protein)
MRFASVAAQNDIMMFPMSDPQGIANIAVEIGQFVQRGDLIAHLHIENFERNLENIDEQINTLRVQRDYLDRTHAVRNRIAMIEGRDISEEYENQRSNIDSQLTYLLLRRGEVEADMNRRILRANFDGYIAQLYQGALDEPYERGRNRSAVVAEVVDVVDSMFRIQDYVAHHFYVGETVLMPIRGVEYEGIVKSNRELQLPGFQNEEQLFIVVPEFEITDFTRTETVDMFKVVESAYDTLYLPLRAVDFVGDVVFIYVVEDGVHVLRQVTTGIIASSFAMVEIIDGVEEGETVVMRR